MRKKQLFALLMAGALSVGMAPTATFAADTTAETSAEGELEGELDSADTEEPSEDPAETPEVQPRLRKIRLKLLPKQQLILQRHRLLKKLMSRLLRQDLRL